MTDLAEHWTTTVIRDVADVFLGKTPARNDYTSNSKYKVVKFRDLKDGFIDFENAKQGFVRTDTSLLRTLKELQCGDVLITSAAHSGENIGKKCAYVSEIPSKFERVYFTGELLNLRCKDETIGKWAYFFFRSRGGFEEIQKAVTGVHLTGGRAQYMSLPIAPLAEQRRIVAKLEKLLRGVDACHYRLARIPALLKRFRQAVLAASCSGRLTADWREKNPDAEPYPVAAVETEEEFPASWRAATLGSLTTLVTSGSRGWAKYYSDSGSTFIRAQNINADFLNLDDIAFVRPPVSAEGLRTKVQQHDILVTITGANVTKSALVEMSIKDAYISQHVALVRLKDTRLSKFVFQSVISATHGRKQLLAAAYGQGKPGLNLDNVRDVVVGLPQLAEQQEIVRRVESLFALADQIEARYAKAKAYVEKLTPSLLARAFRGELVPQDPNDEPASALLERIRKNKSKPDHATKRLALRP
jgi:type I restriction enzyme, S subunit